MSGPGDSDRTETGSPSDYRADATPAEADVAAVAEATGRSPLELDPLREAVDTDALNALFGNHENRRPSVTVSFDYCGERVTVAADGVRVTPSDGPD